MTRYEANNKTKTRYVSPQEGGMDLTLLALAALDAIRKEQEEKDETAD